ncbi:Pectate lyase L precursor [compost metagenome]
MKIKKRFSFTACIALSAMLAFGGLQWGIPSVHAASLFSEDFESGSAGNWTSTTGTWSVVQDGGSYVYYQSGSAEGRTSAGSSAWTDYSVKADVKIDNFNGNNRTYVCGRYQDGNNYYAASISNSNGGTLEIRKKSGGESTTLASKTGFAITTGTVYNIRLELSGDSISMYVNNVLQLNAHDNIIASGGVGLIAYKTAAKFDNVIVSDTTAVPTSTPGTSAAPTNSPTATPTVAPTAAPTPTATPAATATAAPTIAPTAAPTATPVSGALYVAANGAAGNAGTIGSPTTLQSALTRVAAGGTIYLRGGTYSFSSPVTIERDNSGTSGARKSIVAYGSEKPVFDFSAQAFASTERGLQIFGHYWHVKGLEVKGAGDNGIFIGGNYNIIENVETHHNRDSGLQISRYASSASSMSDWPSYNQIIGVYSHDNFDPDNGEDADGFAAKLTIGPGNVFDRCIAAWNTDDGWDLYTKTDTGPIGVVTIKNSIAYKNGQTSDGNSTSNSDGNGFKLGGESISVNHIVTNSIAFQNKKHGFTYNSNPGSIKMTNNTSWSNGGSNYAFDAGTHVFTNNLSFAGASSDKTSGTDVSSTNVWWKNKASTNGKGLVVSSADFVSLTPAVVRNADGSFSLGNFLKLATGSDLIGSGTPSGTNIGATIQ